MTSDEILEALLDRHFHDLTWSYVEDTSVEDVDPELASEIRAWQEKQPT